MIAVSIIITGGKNMFSLSLQLMLYGLAGVFAALTVIYIFVRVIVKLFPYKEKRP